MTAAESDRLYERLLALLTEQRDGHAALLEVVRAKREAIRSARIDDVTRICRDEQQRLEILGGLEQRRLDVVDAITADVAPGRTTPMRMRELTECGPERLRVDLARRADELREALDAVGRESSIVNAAAQALNRHLSGIVQTLHRTLSQAGVYERKGRIAIGAQMDYCVDVKT